MVDFIFDEQSLKTTKSNFLKIKDGAKIRLKSNLIRLKTFFDKKTNKTILWEEGVKEKPRAELYYWGIMEDEEGVIRLPMSVFLAMNEVERLMKKDKRRFEWLIGKKGEGFNTRYNVIKGNEIEIKEEEIKEANKKLFEILHSYEKKLKERLSEYKGKNEKKQENKKEEIINPEDVPF